MPFHTNIAYYIDGDPADGTAVPAVPNGRANEPLNQLLENTVWLKNQVDSVVVVVPAVVQWSTGFSIGHPISVLIADKVYSSKPGADTAVSPLTDDGTNWSGPYKWLQPDPLVVPASVQTVEDLYKGLAAYPDAVEAQKNTVHVLGARSVAWARNKVFGVSGTGTISGGATGQDFDSLESAVRAAPTGATTTIVLNIDQNLSTPIYIENKHIIIKTDNVAPDYTLAPTRNITRVAGTDGSFMVKDGTLEMLQIGLQYSTTGTIGAGSNFRFSALISMLGAATVRLMPLDIGLYYDGTVPGMAVGCQVDCTGGSSPILSSVGAANSFESGFLVANGLGQAFAYQGQGKTHFRYWAETPNITGYTSVPVTGINL